MTVHFYEVMEERGDNPGSDENIKCSDIFGLEDPLVLRGNYPKISRRYVKRNCNNCNLDRCPDCGYDYIIQVGISLPGFCFKPADDSPYNQGKNYSGDYGD